METHLLIHEVAKMIDHALLHPTLTDAEMRDGCQTARQYNVASVCIKPYAIPLAVDELRGSDVRVGTVIGFPSGSHSTAIKVAETIDACQNGAEEIDMVVNIGKVLADDWAYVQAEIAAVQQVCREHNALLKVIFETDYLPEDRFITRLCEICTTVGVGYVKTSTGFGFVKGPDGRYSYKGATLPHLRLMLAHVGSGVGVKASGGIRTLDELLEARTLGVGRIGTSSTVSILEEAYRRFGRTTDAPGTPLPLPDDRGY
ncbi:deoxyribose-phosphate aldolase [Rudanella paleaurantiibacter]|uniref:Deoxyribose-phosphate aldolase n=1 Tax=Rudanella paleaurantiibacter TaxID=2614655 RepID=A0A7J5TYN1_9BACT|nr:deoxyribose-phosphate aldolase [Rudanella paleaurantiibacter]KAB7730248.1 deoxyribose-phosphate aldolase [Rudanella paleaurantiibacter]